MKILANDGVSPSGVKKLEEHGHEVIQKHIAQDQLTDYINKNDIHVLLVRSATKVRKDLIDSCSSLKGIGRGGVGMDNIDVEYARNYFHTSADGNFCDFLTYTPQTYDSHSFTA